MLRNSTLSLLLRIILWSILNVKILLNIEKKLAWNIFVEQTKLRSNARSHHTVTHSSSMLLACVAGGMV